MMFLSVVVLAFSITQPLDSKLYGGLTLEQWQTRLGQLDPKDPHSASAVPALIAIIGDDDLPSDVRRPFAMTLGRMGAASCDALPTLIAQIQQRDRLAKPTYTWAARALGLYGVQARPAVPALVDLLFDEDIPQGERTLPIEALARIGTSHPEVMPALIRLLQYQGVDPSKVNEAQASVFRELAAEAFSFMGPDADLAAPLLVRAVRNVQETDAVRRKAIVALGAMGGRAALAIPALIETMEFEQVDALRVAASETLGRIGPPALPLLQRYLRHTDPQVRCYAVQGIARMGKQARPALPTLVAALSDPDPAVCMAICTALDAIDAAPASYVPQLIQLLASDERQVRMNARRLLRKLGPKARPYRAQVQQLTHHSSSVVRAIARKTLQEMDSE